MSADRPHSRAAGTAKPARRLAFSTPMGVSAVAVLAVAIMAGLVLLGPRGLFGVGLATSPSPEPSTPSPSASVDATPTDEATPEPTASPAPPTASPQPTPAPVAVWTGLEWSEPAIRSDEQPWLTVFDSLSWKGRYVGVGQVDMADGTDDEWLPVFLESPDGVNWDVVQELDVVDRSISILGTPFRVVESADGVVAFSGHAFGSETAPTLWRSPDGHSWTLVESPSSRDGWLQAIYDGMVVAGGPSGIVAIGSEGSGCCMNPFGPAIVGHSPDGLTWNWLQDEPIFRDAHFSDVASNSGGFVLVGRVGQGRQPGQEAMGRPAAWTSPDGRTWTAAAVDGPEVMGGTLKSVLVGANGLFATGVAGPHDWSETTHGWASRDGRSWTIIGELGTTVPMPQRLASDGIRMLIMGAGAWISTDGIIWTQLAYSGAPAPTGFVPYGPDGWAPTAGVVAKLGDVRLQPDGIVAYGQVATESDPWGPWAAAKWIATAIEQ